MLGGASACSAVGCQEQWRVSVFGSSSENVWRCISVSGGALVFSVVRYQLTGVGESLDVYRSVLCW